MITPGPVIMVVGFSTTNSWISRAIRWGSRSEVSHSYMRFSIAGEEIILHADYRGIEALGMKRFCSKNTVVMEFVVDLPWQPLIAEIVEELGTPYDFLGLLGQVIMNFGNLIGKNWDNPFQDEYLWYCSEFCAYLLSLAGEPLPAKPSAISPKVLLTIMQKSPHVTRLAERTAA